MKTDYVTVILLRFLYINREYVARGVWFTAARYQINYFLALITRRIAPLSLVTSQGMSWIFCKLGSV